MARKPYEVSGGGTGYGFSRARGDQAGPRSEAAATTFAGSASRPDGYLVGGEAPLDSAPVVAGRVDPREAGRRRILVIALAIASVVAVIALLAGMFVFGTEAPSENPSQDVPAPALDENGNVNPAEGL